MELEQNEKKKKKKTKNPMQHQASQETEKSCQQLVVKADVFSFLFLNFAVIFYSNKTK